MGKGGNEAPCNVATAKRSDELKDEYPSHSIWDAQTAEHRYTPEFPSRRPPQGADVVSHYGQSFVWTADHWHKADLEPLRKLGDREMDDLLDELDLSPRDDVITALRKAAAASPRGGAARFMDDMSSPPTWVDWTLIAHGQGVFTRYLVPASVSLYNVSLVAGFSIPKVTKVLEQSGYLVGSPHAAMRRLFETGLLLVDSTATEGALRPGGAGWCTALRVRALHAKVRRRLLRKSRTVHSEALSPHASTWDVDEYGVPINQEDMAATLLAFSYNVLIGIEVLRGDVPLPEDDQVAYLHLWRYLGHLLGVRDDLNPCSRGVSGAKAFLESVVVHLLEPDDLSRRVATSLLRAPLAVKGMSEGRVEAGYMRNASVTRLMVGDELGDALGLPFDVGARTSALRYLRLVRLYTRACSTWLLGDVLQACHRLMLRAVQITHGEHSFPMLDTGCPMANAR